MDLLADMIPESSQIQHRIAIAKPFHNSPELRFAFAV